MPVLRTMQDKNKNIKFPNTIMVSVDDYGAAGDGMTDDHIAIQQALDDVFYAGGGTVYFTPGKIYLTTAAFFVRDYTNIYAYGAIIKAKGTTELLVNQGRGEEPTGYSGHSHIVVEGGTWDCDAADGSTGTNYGQNGISFTHCEDIVIKQVTVLNTAVYHAIEYNACRRSKILNCTLMGFKRGNADKEAIQLDVALKNSGNKAWDGAVCHDIEISGCICKASERLPAHPIFVGSHTTYENNYYTGIIVKDNVVDSGCGISCYYWENCIISGNIITGKGVGIETKYSNNIIITDNIFGGSIHYRL